MYISIKNHHIGIVSIESLKNFITDSKLCDDNVIYLNPNTFDDIVLEYRSYFDKPMVAPLILLGIHIVEDRSNRVPIQRVGVNYDS